MSRIAAFSVAAALLATPALADEAAELWTKGVQPLFDQHCVKCHGPLEQKNGLELDTIESALKGSEDGPVIVPGKPDESLLFEAIMRGSDPHMPPKKQLTDVEIAKVRAWIAGLAGGLNEKAARGGDDRAPIAAAPADPSAAIDHWLALGWKTRAVQPAPPCDDRTFLRRVYLDLAGRIPTRQEADAFLFDASPEKRAQLVDRLLASDDYPRAFREIWDVLLMGRGAGRRDRRREENGWFAFLERAFKENRPWDEVVRAIITARPELPSDKGALWFVYERRNDHQRIAEAIAPVIYGTKLDCAQCHDHPLAREIKQGHYWGLVAAFNRSKNSERGSPAVAESAVGGFINFTNLKKESQPAMLAMLTGRTIEEERPASGAKESDPAEAYVDPAAPVRIPKFSRRAALAEAATCDNPLLARAFVNYTWAILMGRGFVHPVDEMNSKNKPSHPELLDWLAADFAKNNFDVRRLVRAIVLSRGYQLGAPGTSDAPPAEAFAAALEKPLLAETLARSARIASGRTLDDAELRRAFAEKFPEVMPRTIRATIQQAMFLAHNDTLAGLFKPDPNTAVSRLGALDAVQDRAREAFRLALIREPDAEELARAVEFLESQPEQPAARIGELLWTLVTGPEFLTNH